MSAVPNRRTWPRMDWHRLDPRRSIVAKLLLLISVILTAIFAGTGYLLERNIAAQAAGTVENEVAGSFRAYEALWNEHTGNLAVISRVISRSADVRAAFLTRDRATIADTAGELWGHLSAAHSLFTVTDGGGRVLANVSPDSPFRDDEVLDFLRGADGSPQQRSGFLQRSGRLFQVIVTPVFVDAGPGSALLNILVTGFEVDRAFLSKLEAALGGSDLIFTMQGRPVAATLRNENQLALLGPQCAVQPGRTGTFRLQAAGGTYLALDHPLPGLGPEQAGELCIIRSLARSQQAIQALRHRITTFWLFGLVTAILATYALVRRTMQPAAVLDKASAEIAHGNFAARVQVAGDDELGRLAQSFNTMCASLEDARTELIRQERLSAVARLATFVVHDLRNPLASIYAGAELLVDHDLPPNQVKRLAGNMYQASRGMMEILSELLATARKPSQPAELCLVADLVSAAWQSLQPRAQLGQIQFRLDIPSDLEIKLDRPPMERVFHNLFENAVDAMPSGGTLAVTANVERGAVLLHVKDTGPGIPPHVRQALFQPFAGDKQNGGLGLGLALSRQTVMANGGELFADFESPAGGHFILRFPLS